MPSSRYTCTRTPFVTFGIVGFCSLLWLVLRLMDYPQAAFNIFGFIPAQPHFPALASSLFIHNGLLYILPAMIFLAILGKQLEDVLGHLFFFVFFMVCGIANTLLFYLWHRSAAVPCLGATGAVAGVIAAFWIIFPNQIFDVEVHLGWWHATDFKARTYAAVAAWVIWQLITVSVEDRVVVTFIVWSNAGGFAVGSVSAFLLKSTLLRRRKQGLLDRTSEASLMAP